MPKTDLGENSKSTICILVHSTSYNFKAAYVSFRRDKQFLTMEGFRIPTKLTYLLEE
jgi:hypothetical protein